MDDELKKNLTAAETWVRGLFILLFAFLLLIARIVTAAVVVIQFIFTVLSGKTNDNLRDFGASLAQFIFQTLLFVTYNSDDKPFPFRPWPEAKNTGADMESVDNMKVDVTGPEVENDNEGVREEKSINEPESVKDDKQEPRA